MSGRRPDLTLKAFNTLTNERSGSLGAAWRNDNGSISLKLDRFVVLTSEENWVLTLWPNEQRSNPVPTTDDDAKPF
jgi:hypothetical protein